MRFFSGFCLFFLYGHVALAHHEHNAATFPLKAYESTVIVIVLLVLLAFIVRWVSHWRKTSSN